MRKIYSLLIIASMLIIGACVKDHSSPGDKAIADITITIPNGVPDTINAEKNQVVTIQPNISQRIEGQPLSYEWQVDYTTVSTEKDLNYTCTKLGKFAVRLKVSNAHGSTFKHFVLFVNSPYEEGIFVLAEGANSEGTISFMNKKSPEQIQAGETEQFEYNAFATNNPGLTLGRKPGDVVKRMNQLYISSAEDRKISLINAKTFELESVVTADEFADFKPVFMNIPDNTARNGYILTESGKIYNFATLEQLVLNFTSIPADVRMVNKTFFVPGINFTSNYYWDATNSRFWNLWYMPSNSLDVLAGQELVQFFPADGLSYIITRDKNNPTSYLRTVFGEYIQEYFATPIDMREQDAFTSTNLTLQASSITTLSTKYRKLVYANGNKIYGWFYSGINFPANPYITLDIPGEVTALGISPDGDQLYVGVYNAAATGLKGSVVIYNIDNGTLISKHVGVADKPVKVFYKVK